MFLKDSRRVPISESRYVAPNFYEKQLKTPEQEDAEKLRIIDQYDLVDLNELKIEKAPYIPPRVYLEMEEKDIIPFKSVLECRQKIHKLKMDFLDITTYQIPARQREYDLALIKLNTDEIDRLSKSIEILAQRSRQLNTMICISLCWLEEALEEG
jgi:hypothetical protein